MCTACFIKPNHDTSRTQLNQSQDQALNTDSDVRQETSHNLRTRPTLNTSPPRVVVVALVSQHKHFND